TEPFAHKHDFGHRLNEAQFACHYAVMYSGAERELAELTNGYRLAILYNIVWPSSHPVPIPSLSDEMKTQLVRALTEASRSRRKFHMFLNKVYSDDAIARQGTDALKNIDRDLVSQLQAANNSMPNQEFRYIFYLAKATRHVMYWYDKANKHRTPRWSTYADKGDNVDLEPGVPDYHIDDFYTVRGQKLPYSADVGNIEEDPGFSFDEDDILNPHCIPRIQLWHGHRKLRTRSLPRCLSPLS
ncbi:unnamed protein product, partial [Tilletia controversa]